MPSSSSSSRQDLEQELDRLQQQLEKIRLQKQQHKRRVELLRLEQEHTMPTSTSTSTSTSTTTITTSNQRQLTALTSTIQQQTKEHAALEREYAAQQELQDQLGTALHILQEKARLQSSGDDVVDNDHDNDEAAARKALMASGRTFRVEDLLSSLPPDDSTTSTTKEEESPNVCVSTTATPADACSVSSSSVSSSSQLLWDTDDHDTIITAQTKDSLQVYREQQQRKKVQEQTHENTHRGTTTTTRMTMTSNAKSSLSAHLLRGGHRMSSFRAKQSASFGVPFKQQTSSNSSACNDSSIPEE